MCAPPLGPGKFLASIHFRQRKASTHLFRNCPPDSSWSEEKTKKSTSMLIKFGWCGQEHLTRDFSHALCTSDCVHTHCMAQDEPRLKVSWCAFHSILKPSMMLCVCAFVGCSLSVSLPCFSPSSTSSLFHALPVLGPARHLQCRYSRGLKPLHSRRMRSIAPWRYTILSQLESVSSRRRKKKELRLSHKKMRKEEHEGWAPHGHAQYRSWCTSREETRHTDQRHRRVPDEELCKDTEVPLTSPRWHAEERHAIGQALICPNSVDPEPRPRRRQVPQRAFQPWLCTRQYSLDLSETSRRTLQQGYTAHAQHPPYFQLAEEQRRSWRTRCKKGLRGQRCQQRQQGKRRERRHVVDDWS